MTAVEHDRKPVAADRLRDLFSPESVAIVGASEASSWATNLVHSLELAGGTKRIVPVHPQRESVFGRPAVPSLADLSDPVDLAFVLLGPDKVPGVIRQAASVGIRSAVVLAGGYGESGDEGRARQHELTDLANELGVAILGPNTIGFINAREGFAPWAVATAAAPLAGPVGAIFESGSMARASFQFAHAHGIGSTLWASVGNAAVVGTLDILDYLIDDPDTRAIALFLETVREPQRFMYTCMRAVEAGKPIVAFKAGKSEEGKRSAMAHTGAIATDAAVVEAAFEQCGIVSAASVEELVSTVGLLGYAKRLPAGRRMGVVTSSGGGCNVIADAAMHHGLALPPWAPSTIEVLERAMPPFSSLFNPLDTTGYGHARQRPRPTKAEDDLMELACVDPGIDFMFTMMTPLPSEPPADPTAIEERMRIIGEIVEASPVPVFMSSNTCMDVAPYPRRLLEENGLHLMAGADLAMRALGHAVRWRELRDTLLGDTRVSRDATAPPGSAVAVHGVWDEHEGRSLLEQFGVSVVPAELVSSADGAAAAAERFAVPVALKICSRDIPHKSDVGGVALGVCGGDDAARAFEVVTAAATERVPDADVRGVLVSPMREPGVELLVGVTVDPSFGPVIAVALGGIWVEILKDTALRVLPVTRRQVIAMVDRLRGSALLKGARGAKPVDLDQLADVIVRIADAALSLGNALESLEVNPLRISSSGIEALDVLVTTKQMESNDG